MQSAGLDRADRVVSALLCVGVFILTIIQQQQIKLWGKQTWRIPCHVNYRFTKLFHLNRIPDCQIILDL